MNQILRDQAEGLYRVALLLMEKDRYLRARETLAVARLVDPSYEPLRSRKQWSSPAK